MQKDKMEKKVHNASVLAKNKLPYKSCPQAWAILGNAHDFDFKIPSLIYMCTILIMPKVQFWIISSEFRNNEICDI